MARFVHCQCGAISALDTYKRWMVECEICEHFVCFQCVLSGPDWPECCACQHNKENHVSKMKVIVNNWFIRQATDQELLHQAQEAQTFGMDWLWMFKLINLNSITISLFLFLCHLWVWVQCCYILSLLPATSMSSYLVSPLVLLSTIILRYLVQWPCSYTHMIVVLYDLIFLHI